MPFNQSLAARVRDVLMRTRDIEEKKMFGGLTFRRHGHLVVGVWKDALIVRVGPEAYEDAMLEPHVREFDPAGRPMRGWVLVDLDGIEADGPLRDWVERALTFVETLPAK